jgi:aspartate/methionine/tyrosine aminotransferase
MPASSLHAIHRLVARRTGETIALHIGEPHVRMPPSAEEAFARALRDGHTRYTDAPGLPAFREALAERLAGNGAPSAEHLFVTPGSCQAIAAVLQSVAVEGGVALLPEVHWPIHLQQVLLAGLTPRFVSMAGDAEATIARLAEAYEPSVCVMILNSPANPSGIVLDRSLVAAVHAWAARHGVWLISDEAYEDFTFEGAAPAAADFDAALPEPERVVFSVHTFSKGYSMTGCRLGYVAVPSGECAERLRRVQEAQLVSPCTPVQYAGLAALADVSAIPAHHSSVRATRDAVVAELGPAGLLWAAPAGGWYALIDLSDYTSDTDAFCQELLDRTGVALAPGYGFFPPGSKVGHGLARLALCEERDLTLEGIRRLREYLGSR